MHGIIATNVVRGRGFEVSTFLHVPNQGIGAWDNCYQRGERKRFGGFEVSTFLHVPN